MTIVTEDITVAMIRNIAERMALLTEMQRFTVLRRDRWVNPPKARGMRAHKRRRNAQRARGPQLEAWIHIPRLKS